MPHVIIECSSLGIDRLKTLCRIFSTQKLLCCDKWPPQHWPKLERLIVKEPLKGIWKAVHIQCVYNYNTLYKLFIAVSKLSEAVILRMVCNIELRVLRVNYQTCALLVIVGEYLKYMWYRWSFWLSWLTWESLSHLSHRAMIASI